MQLELPEAQCIDYDADARKRHRGRRQNRVKLLQKWRRPSEGRQDAGCNRKRGDVVARCPAEVLSDIWHGRLTQYDRLRNAAQIASNEGHVGRLHRHVSPCPVRDVNVGLGKCRRGVNAVAKHCHTKSFRLHRLRLTDFLAGQQLCDHTADACFPCYPRRRLSGCHR